MPRGYYQVQVTDTGGVLAGAVQTSDPDAVLDGTGDVPLLAGATNFTMNFGYQNAAFADVSGTVFDDTDIDGVHDAGESGISGVTLELVHAGPDGTYGTADDLQVATTTTDASGNYSFPDVAGGSYRVVVTDVTAVLNGYTLTSGLDQIDVTVAGADVTGVDFGYVRVPGTASIGTSVWLDANRDGVLNPSENGIANATLELYTPGPDGVIGGGDDVLVATTSTDLLGNYLFSGLAAGTYYVDVVDGSIPAGLALTGSMTDPTGLILLSDGAIYVDADFGYASATGSAIGDTVFFDANGDGIQGSGEAGIGGVDLTVSGPSGSFTVTTAADGTWLVPGLAPGTYTVTVDTATLPPGFNTTPTNGPASRNYPIAAGSDFLRADFGFDAPATAVGSIGDLVFFDTNGDGVQNAGEGGIAGVTLTVTNASGVIVATATTDANGAYDFTGLVPGSYTVEVTDLSAVLAGLNLSAGTSPTAPIALAGGDDVNSADFGYTASGGSGSIGDFIWHDTDGSGDVNGAEASLGLQGVTVDLYVDVNGNGTLDAGVDNLVRTTTTDVLGAYQLNGLPPASYLVTVTDTAGVLTGFAKTSGAAGVDDNSQTDPYLVILGSGATDFTADFGYQGAGTNTISGTTFFDVDGDGSLNGFDNGVADATIYLYRDLDGDGVLDVTDPRIGLLLSDANGDYLFDNLPDGEFIVAVDVSGTFLASSIQTTQVATAGVQPVSLAGSSSPGNHFGFTISATLVNVMRFGAYDDAGQVVVEWVTGSEVGTLGFYVFRYDPVEEMWIQIHDEILPGLNAAQGGEYRVVDEDAPLRGRVTYILFEAEEGGGQRHYGPYDIRIAPNLRAHERMMHRFEARARRRPAAMSERLERARMRRAARQRIRGARGRGRLAKPAMKLTLTDEGAYFVSSARIASELARPEAAVRNLVSRGRLKLENRGREVAWLPAGDASGLYFYGEALETMYTSENVYWLRPGRGKTMAVLDGSPGSGLAPIYRHREHLEEDVFAATVASKDPDADFWYWSSLMASHSSFRLATYSVDTDRVVPGAAPAVLEVSAYGATSTPHRLRVRVNGTAIGEGTWSDVGPNVLRFELDASVLAEGTNTIEVEAVLEPGIAFDVVYVNALDLSYPRLHQAFSGALAFDSARDGIVTVAGLSGSGTFAALDVSEPAEPKWLYGVATDADTARFQARFGARYFVYGQAAVREPEITTVDTLASLGLGRADYLIITPQSLEDAAEELASYRRSGGLRSQVVTLEAIHDEYGYGIVSPHNVKRFLTYVYEHWRKRPRFVVLLGKGTMDYKDAYRLGDNLLPPVMTATPLGLYASDNRLADVSGDDGIPEFLIGRIPVLSDEELRAYIDKLAAFEGAGLGEALFFADDPDVAGNFTADSEAVRALVPEGVTTHTVYLTPATAAEARQALFDRLDAGVSFANYIGHGGLDRLASEGLLLASDVPSMTNSETPILASLTCTVGRFEIPGWVSLGEALVTERGKGTVATWAPSGLSYNVQAILLNRAFVEALYDPNTRYLGEAVQRALESFAREGELPFMLSIYNLLGDPAVTLR